MNKLTNDWKNEAQRILKENFPDEEHDMIIHLMQLAHQGAVREVIEKMGKYGVGYLNANTDLISQLRKEYNIED